MRSFVPLSMLEPVLLPSGRVGCSLSMLLVLALLFATSEALAQGGAGTPGGGVITDIKSPLLQNSDTFVVPISIHNTAPNPPWAGWAGGIVTTHILDPSEIDSFTLHSATNTGHCAGGACNASVVLPPSAVTGAPGSQVASQPFTINWWHPNAQQSGIPLTPSVNQPLLTLGIHVGNSDPSNNSDVDATFQFWNIWHIREGLQGSTLVQLHPSDRVWVTSNFNDPQQLHTAGSFYRFPTQHPTPFQQNAHWLHITQSAVFHLTGFDASAFYATKLNTATLGIEHVPEPASGALMALGLTAIAASRTMRRQRLAV